MNLRSLGPIIATRTFTDAKGAAIEVRIGKPRRFRGGHPDYYCPFQIRGIDKDVRYAGGVDAVQALQLAMKAIGLRLAGCGRALRWMAEQGVGDLGFPGVEQNRPNKRLEKALTRVFSKAFAKSIKASRNR